MIEQQKHCFCLLMLVIIMGVLSFGLLQMYTPHYRSIHVPHMMTFQNISTTIIGFYSENEPKRHPFKFNYTMCPSDIKKQESKSSPKHYPENGTGRTVADDGMFPPIYMEQICQTSPPLKAILPVYSAIHNFERRMALRKTIGKECQLFNCKVTFICGITKDQSIMKKLQTEYITYKDIIIVFKVDTYRDLNNKAVEMLDWLLKHCYQPRYVIHFIDDTYVNIRLFYKDLEKSGESILGSLCKNGGPIRGMNRKCYVSPEEYPYAKYPKFIYGAAYGFPNTVTLRLQCAVTKAIYIWLEDVWIMGLVRVTAGIKATETTRPTQRLGKINHSTAPTCLYVHSVGISDMYRIYDLVTESSKKTSNAEG